MSKQYKFIGGPQGHLINLCGSVTLKSTKTDGSTLIIENIIPQETIITVDDEKVIKSLDLNPQYQEV